MDLVFYRHGYAMQRPPVMALLDLLLGLAGIAAGLFGADGDISVDHRVYLLYAVQVRLHRFHRGDLLCFYKFGQFGDGEMRYAGAIHARPPLAAISEAGVQPR